MTLPFTLYHSTSLTDKESGHDGGPLSNKAGGTASHY